jgi:hypothetical protein
VIKLDLNKIRSLLYLTPTGRAVQASLLVVLAHELVHAITNSDDDLTPQDYAGETVRFANDIYSELGLPLQLSYTGKGFYDEDKDLKQGYDYTNGSTIDIAALVRFGENLTVNGGLSTVVNGNSRDLLIGDINGNTLSSGAGADFLWGMGGNDTLDGGEGIDTAGYYAAIANFKFREQGNEWILTQFAGADNAGADTLRNIEKVRFGNKVYDLKESKDIVILLDLSAPGVDFTKLSSMILRAVSDSGKIISDTRVKIAAYGQNGLVQSKFFRDLHLPISRNALQQFVNGIESGGYASSTIRYDQQILNILSSNSSLWRSDVEKKIIAISGYYEEYNPSTVQLTEQVQLSAASSGVGIDRLVYDSRSGSSTSLNSEFDYNNSAGAVMLYKPYLSPENPGNLDQLINASFNRPEIQADISLTNVSVNYSSLSGGAVVSDFLLTSGAIPGNSELTYEISGEDYNGRIFDGNISIRNNKLVVDEGFTTHFGGAPDLYDYSTIVGYHSGKLDFIVSASISGLPVAIYDKVSLEITNIPEYKYIGPF